MHARARPPRDCRAQAFLAVDFIIERHGLPAVIDYFSRFGGSADPLANFSAAFGESRAAFEAALAARLRRPTY